MNEPNAIAGLMALRASAKTLADSEVTQPHEKVHLRSIIGRIDDRVKEEIDDRVDEIKGQGG